MLCRAVLVAGVVLVLVGGYVVRYRSFVRSLRGFETAVREGFAEQDFPLLDRHQATQLGMAHLPGARPAGSYTAVDTEKRPGTTRVGVFGCSFVAGSEAPHGQDFPSQLQHLLAAEGRTDVEVVNFGVGGFGVQQSYLLWRYLAGDFALDLTIFNLYGFHRLRDDTFIMLDSLYAPVHARFVNDGASLRLIEVAGGDRREAAARYFRLRPTWAYLRYDAKAPPQVRALLPSGHDLPNLLYYRSGQDGEIAELYARIFADMSAGSGRFLVLANDDNAEQLLTAGGDRGFPWVRTATESYTWRRSGFFRAPENHLSALGYRVLALETRGLVQGCPSVTMPEIEILGVRLEAGLDDRDLPLLGSDEPCLALDGRPVGVFVERVDNRSVAPYSFGERGARALLDVSGGRRPLFIAVKRTLPAGELRLDLSVAGRPVCVPIGRVLRTAGCRVGVVDRAWETVEGEGWRLRARPERGVIALELGTEEPVDDLRLTLGELTLLRGSLAGPNANGHRAVVWSSAGGDLLTTRGHPRQLVEELLDGGGGRYGVAAVSPDGTDVFWPTRGWRLGQATIALASAGPPML